MKLTLLAMLAAAALAFAGCNSSGSVQGGASSGGGGGQTKLHIPF